MSAEITTVDSQSALRIFVIIMINTQKGMRPIYSHLDRTTLVKKGSIIWLKSELFPCGTNAGNPELARWSHLTCSGSQSDSAYRLV